MRKNYLKKEIKLKTAVLVQEDNETNENFSK